MDEDRQIPDPVQWDQGMLLTPRHFLELAGRYELLQQEMATLRPFDWGVTRLEFEKEEVAAGKIEISSLEAVMPDGTLITASRGDIPPITLPEPQSVSTQTIWLTLPAQKEFAWEGPAARYHAAMTGSGSRSIPRLRPNLALFTEKPPDRFVSIPLLRVECSNFSTRFVNNYEPPWLSIPGGSALIGICEKVVSLLRGKMNFLVAQIRNPSQALAGVTELKDRLRSLVSALPVLEAHISVGAAGAQFGHPFPIYLALCSIAGNVALLGHDLIPPDFAAYDHRDLLGSFRRVAQFIELAVNQGISEHWVPLRMEPVAGGFELSPSEALSQYRQDDVPWPALVIGLRIGANQTRQNVLEWAERCLIATGDITTKRENRVRGAGRKEWINPPDLAPPAGMLLFAIEKGDETLDLEEQLHLKGEHPIPGEAMLFVRQTQRRSN